MTDLLDAIESCAVQPGDTTLADTLLLGFDTETTGTLPGEDAICSATLVLRDQSRGHDGDVIASWLINPHRPVSPGASRVNGFTDDYLQANGEEPAEALERLASIIAAAQNRRIPLLAYNAPFDVRMVSGDLLRWRLTPLDGRLDADELLVVDPLVIDRQVSHRKGKRTLTDTTFYYGVQPHGDFHDATADTIAAVDLIRPIATLYPQTGSITLDGLMDWQRSAYAQWRDSFNRWLVDRGRTPIHDRWL